MVRNPACLSGSGCPLLLQLNPLSAMKRLFLLFPFLITPLFAQMGVSVLVKQHADRTDNFAERPYGDEDLSYGAYLDLFEGVGGWRFGASYSGDLTGLEVVDSVITPEISLLVVDRIWETGISLLIDYIDVDGDTAWGDLYFQTQLGINLPLGDRIQLGAHAYYPLESISDITDIGFSDLDVAVQLRVMF